MSHSKAFPQQSKPGRNSHSSNRYVCVVFAHRTNTERGKNNKPLSYSSSVWAPLQAFTPSRATPYLQHGGLGQSRGWGGGSRIPVGLTQSPLMEPGVERPRTQQHNLKMPLEGLILRLLLCSSVILRLMLIDNTSLSRCLFQHPPAPFFYFQHSLIPDYLSSTRLFSLWIGCCSHLRTSLSPPRLAHQKSPGINKDLMS